MQKQLSERLACTFQRQFTHATNNSSLCILPCELCRCFVANSTVFQQTIMQESLVMSCIAAGEEQRLVCVRQAKGTQITAWVFFILAYTVHANTTHACVLGVPCTSIFRSTFSQRELSCSHWSLTNSLRQLHSQISQSLKSSTRK